MTSYLGRFASVVVVSLCLSGVVGCTDSQRVEDNLGNLVFPNTDFTGRSYEIVPMVDYNSRSYVSASTTPAPLAERTQTVYASWYDRYNLDLRGLAMAVCEGLYLQRTVDDEGWILDPSSDALFAEYFNDGDKCGLDAYKRASKAVCVGQILLRLAEATTPQAVYAYRRTASNQVRYKVAIQDVDESREPYEYVRLMIVPPQRAHGAGTLALEALTHFRDGATWAVRALDADECGTIPPLVLQGESSSGVSDHPSAEIPLSVALSVLTGEALDLIDGAYGVASRNILGSAHARLADTSDETEATKLSWRAPYDSRLELVNHLLGAKPALFEPIPLWLPQPEFTADGGVPIADTAQLLEVPATEVGRILKGEYPVVEPTPLPEDRAAMNLVSGYGIDFRVWDGTALVAEPEIWLENATNLAAYETDLTQRVRTAVMRDRVDFRDDCALQPVDLVEGLGTSGTALVRATRRLRQQVAALGQDAVWDDTRGDCEDVDVSTCEPAESSCESVVESDWADRRVIVRDPGGARGAYYFALAVARSRNIPGLNLPADAGAEPSVGLNYAPHEPPTWYPGNYAPPDPLWPTPTSEGPHSEIAGEATGIAFAASAARGYSGQGLIQTRDFVAMMVSRALRAQAAATRTDLADAVGVLSAVYAKEREAVPMRLEVCAGTAVGDAVEDIAISLYAPDSELYGDHIHEFRIVPGEEGLLCALDPQKRLDECGPTCIGGPCWTSHLGLYRTNTALEFPASRLWSWNSAPVGRYYLVRRPKSSAANPQTDVPTTVLASFTLEPGGWTRSGENAPVSHYGTTHCNWYPAGPAIFSELESILKPGNKPQIPERMCGGVNQDIKLPLEDSLTNASISGETIESSFRYFLGLARQAADEADLLGQDLITNGLAMDIRAEEAVGELEERCGAIRNVTSFERAPQVACPTGTCETGDCVGGFCDTGLEAPNGEENPSLKACLGTDRTRVDASLGTIPLCVFRFEGKGNVCELQRNEEINENVNIVACPFQVGNDAECKTRARDYFVGLPVCSGSNTTGCYVAKATTPMALVDEEVQPPAPVSCEALALFRQEVETGQVPAQGEDDPVFDLAGQPWYGIDGAVRALSGLTMTSLAPEMMMGVSGESYDSTSTYDPRGVMSFWDGTPPVSFVQLKVNGRPFLRTGSREFGPNLGEFPFAKLFPEDDPIYGEGKLSCESNGDRSWYCPFATPTASNWMSDVRSARVRLEKAFREAARLAALQIVPGRAANPRDELSNWEGETGLAHLSGDQHLGTHLRTTVLPLWMSTNPEVLGRYYDDLGIDLDGPSATSYSLAKYARGVDQGSGYYPSGQQGIYYCIGDAGAGGTCWRESPTRVVTPSGMWFDTGVTYFHPHGDNTVALAEPAGAADAGASARRIASAQRAWADITSTLEGGDTEARRVLLDALELTCHAALAGGGSPSARCGYPTSSLATPQGIEVLQVQLECAAQAFDNNAGWLVLQDVPAGLPNEVASRGGRNVGGGAGTYQVAVGKLASSFEGIVTSIGNVSSLLRQGGTKLEIVESQLRQLDLAADAAAARVDVAEVEADIVGLRAEFERQSAVFQTLEATALLVTAVSFTGLNGGQGIANAALGGVHLLQAAGRLVHAGVLEKLQNNVARLNVEIARTQGQQIDEQVTQTLLEAVLAYQGVMSEVDTNLSAMNQAAGQIYSVLAEIDQNGAAAARALGKASFLSRDDVGREYNVNRVMRSRMNSGRIRYERARDNAIKMAWIARRAVEQRIGVDLSQLHGNMTLVPPPATWADKICTMTGINYDEVRAVGEQEIDNYADEYIGDYVTLLENFVESYRFDYPFQDGQDVAVISMRDEVFSSRTLCDAAGQNLLLWSIDPSREVLNTDEPGWYGVPATNDLRGIGVTDAPDVAGPFITENGRRPNGDVNAYRIALGLPEDGDGFNGVSNATWSQRIPALPSGAYRVSWYEQLTDTLMGTACTTPLSGVNPKVNLVVRDAAGMAIMPTAAAFVAVADDDPLLDGCSWRRVTATFTNLTAQDLVLGFQLVAAVDIGLEGDLSDDVLPSAVFAAPQLEGPTTNSAPPSSFFPTDDDYSYPVRTCADTEGKHFASSLNWGYGCEGFCPEGVNASCTSNVRCFREASFNISLADIERGKLGQAGGFAVGNFNYRFNEVGINLVGTGLRDCASTDTPATCYSSAFIPYSIRHSPPYRIRNYEGDVVEGNLFPGNIEHAKGLMAERYITNPIGSADRTLMTDYWRQEFRGRPLEGNFRLRIWESPGFDFSKLEDIQLIMSYRYWTRAQ